MKSALITGAAGFIGSHLADYLIEKGYTVYGIDNFLTGDRENINHKVNFIETDIRNTGLDKIFENCDTVFHLAAIARTLWTVEAPLLANDINITGTLNVLEAAKRAKVKKVVFASSNIVYAENTPYWVSKKAGEMYMQVYNNLHKLPTISLRFSNVYGSLRQSEKGPSINVLASLRQSKRDAGYIWITGDGTQSRDFTHVDDICEALLLAAESDVHGKTLDICTGVNTTMNEIAKYFDCEVKYVDERIGDIKHIIQSPHPAKALLGFRAKKKLSENIQVYL